MQENTTLRVNHEQSDSLLQCLVLLTQFYQRPYSAQALRAGLPILNEPFTPQLFIRAAELVGLKARVIKREIEHISNLVLPVVLLLKDNQACLLHKIHLDQQTVEIEIPEIGEGLITKKIEELNELYTGKAIFVQQTYRFSETGEEFSQGGASWFWGTLLRYRFAYIKVILAAFLINIFALLSPLYVMNVYDRVVSNRVLATLWVLSIGILIVFVFDFILRFLRAYLIDVIGKKADILMASNLFQKVLNLQLSQKPKSVGYFVSNLREFEVLRDFFTSATLVTIIDFPFVILYLIFIGYIGEYVVLVPLIAIPIIVVITLLFNPPLQTLTDDIVTKSSQRHAVLVETVGSFEIIKSLVMEAVMQKKWEHYVSEGAKLSLKARFLSSFVTNVTMLIQQCITVGVIIVGVYEILNNQMSLGGLIACSILSGRIMVPMSQMVGLLTRYQQSKTALVNLNKLMALPAERTPGKKYLQLPAIKGEIEFRNVSFQYPHQETKALDDVSFKIKAGEHIAILGRVGSGKSTLQKLILGLFQPTEGTVYIDGIDICQLDPIDVRHSMGYVPQETILFAGTIRDNILMGKAGASDAEIIEAAQLSGAERFIKEHPQGYHWVVGERGEGLSGGQRQSITIARAILNNGPILLLDEPTSGIDDTSEMELIQRLVSFAQNKTLILVTHRLSLLNLVSRLIVMKAGKIVIDGPRDEVLAKLQAPNNANRGKPA